MNDGLADLYQEEILDHSRTPRNFGSAEDANRRARGNNPLCGDRVSVYLLVNENKIKNACFEARGCAISIASASMMTEMIKGKTLGEAKSLVDQFHRLITCEVDANTEGDLAELQSLSGVRAFPTRIKCATLAWHAMTAALDQTEDEVRTE